MIFQQRTSKSSSSGLFHVVAVREQSDLIVNVLYMYVLFVAHAIISESMVPTMGGSDGG